MRTTRGRRAAVALLVLLLAACTDGSASREVARRGATGTGAPALPSPGGLVLRPPDGGADPYTARPASLPDDPADFPLLVWFESVTSPADVEADRDAGLGGYVALTANSDLAIAEAGGMSVFAQTDEWADRPAARASSAVKGWLLGDEVDMKEGPGTGYRTMSGSRASVPADDGRLRYANYGKGVAFWETDAEARRFAREFQDVVSLDLYWYTDPGICRAGEGGLLLGDGAELTPGTCRKAANYGATVARLRDLLGAGHGPADRPVWNYVEVGHPFSEPDAPTITGPQMQAAVWHSLIAGARGIVYFNHSFAGDCVSAHVLRDACGAEVRRTVTEVNARVRQIAPALNGSFLDGWLSVPQGIAASARLADGRVTVLAGSTADGEAARTLRLPCTADGDVEVLFEDRTVPLRDGAFTDVFDGETAVHTYRLPRECTPDV